MSVEQNKATIRRVIDELTRVLSRKLSLPISHITRIRKATGHCAARTARG